MSEVILVHLLNQFFAGLGKEELAAAPVGVLEGAVGPGRLLQSLLPPGYTIAATVFCGDNYLTEHPEEAKRDILKAVRKRNPSIFIAGPAFDSGRYGVTCAEITNLVSAHLGIFSISAMFEQNPGVEIYRNWRNPHVFFFPTSQTIVGMKDSLTTIARFVTRLSVGDAIGDAHEEGYLPRGIRPVVQVRKSGVQRAIEMLLAKVHNQPYATEIPYKEREPVSSARAIGLLSAATIALVTTSGLVPYGNPDGFKRLRNIQWKKYPLEGLVKLEKGRWQVIHGGYSAASVDGNPHLAVPLDVMRDLEKERIFDRLHAYLQVTSGAHASVNVMKQIGREIAEDLKTNGVQAVILTST